MSNAKDREEQQDRQEQRAQTSQQDTSSAQELICTQCGDRYIVRRADESSSLRMPLPTKYDIEPLEASKRFLTSQTHAMLEDPEYAMWEFKFSERAIFDIWEVEQITGDPRKSVYIRCE